MDYQQKWHAALTEIQVVNNKLESMRKELKELRQFKESALHVVPDLKLIIYRKIED